MRVSIFGGGTDLPFYFKKYGTRFISFAINKYVYVTVQCRSEERIVVVYSKREDVARIEDVEHNLVREALKKYQPFVKGIEIHLISDISTIGTGLGGSSAFAVAIVATISEWGVRDILLNRAYELENKLCREPAGIQDFCPAIFGNIRYYKYDAFNHYMLAEMPNKVFIEKYGILIPAPFVRGSSSQILKDQVKVSSSKLEWYHLIKAQSERMINPINWTDVKTVGAELNKYWGYKQRLADHITNPTVNKLMAKVKGKAYGAKLCGAGGGGYIFALMEPKYHKQFEHISFKISEKGVETFSI